MYSGGLSTRDISRTLEALLESKYSPQRVSSITQKALERAEAFRKRRIEKWYPTIYVDGTFLKVRREGEGGRGSGLLRFGGQRGGIEGSTHLLPCFLRGERRGLEGGSFGLQGEGIEGTLSSLSGMGSPDFPMP